MVWALLKKDIKSKREQGYKFIIRPEMGGAFEIWDRA
jgi:hypothetical protein